MENQNIQEQLDQMNAKIDLILGYVNQQRLKTAAVDDLIADLSIIGKDMYDSAVAELDNQNVEIDPDELRLLGIRLIKNIKTFNQLLSGLESANDFIKDAMPIANDVIIDMTKKLHTFEDKGYFAFAAEMGRLVDNVVTHFSANDVKQLADNIVTILQTVKDLTQPQMMEAINNGIRVYGSMSITQVPEYSIFRLLREINTPEMKKSIGFMVTFLKNLSTQNEYSNH